MDLRTRLAAIGMTDERVLSLLLPFTLFECAKGSGVGLGPLADGEAAFWVHPTSVEFTLSPEDSRRLTDRHASLRVGRSNDRTHYLRASLAALDDPRLLADLGWAAERAVEHRRDSAWSRDDRQRTLQRLGEVCGRCNMTKPYGSAVCPDCD